MTELRHFLAAIYDAASEAEMTALLNGHRRLRQMTESEEFPADTTLPVYHARDISVTLDVGLEARQTKHGIEVVVTESADDDTALELDLEVYDILQGSDLAVPDEELSGRDRPKRRSVDLHVPLGNPLDDPTEEVGEREFEKGADDPTTERPESDERPARTKSPKPDDEATKNEGKDDENNDERNADNDEHDRRTDDDRTQSENSTPGTEKSADVGRPGPFPGLGLPEDWPSRRGNRGTGGDRR